MIKEGILALWRGKMPLWAAYWGWGVLGNMTFLGLARILEDVLRRNPGGFFPILAGLGLALVSFIYTIIVLVSVWSSASKYQGWRAWAILAKVSVIVVALRGLGELAGILL